MFKKIAIGLLIAITAIFLFGYIKLQQLQHNLSEKLVQQDIQFQQLNVNFLPKPIITLAKLQYSNVNAEQAEIRFNLFPLFPLMNVESIQLKEINLKSIKFNEKSNNTADISAKFSDFTLDNIRNKSITFSGTNEIHIKLAKPLYAQHRSFDVFFKKGKIEKNQQYYHFILDHTELNQQPLGYIEGNADFSISEPIIYSKINGYNCQSPCSAQFYLAWNKNRRSVLNFSGNGFPLKQILALLRFPETLTGTADFNLHLAFDQSTMPTGYFRFNARNGELLGLNLIELVGQYLPVNYDQENLKNKSLNTRYKQFNTELSLQDNKLQVDKIQLKTTALYADGKGYADLLTMQCQANLTLSAVNLNYEKIALPIQFFGNCYSPQYKIDFNRNFRQDLKDLIKQKFK
ncbi:AsmA-like C-terminal region-containing protein [Rodentibacter caecimuris]|uniref:AsmA-like C-terminal domain-containing protein n=1 Tax=Rodentibacter caecimuris TaxID=1796644 RepID=A0ABX3KW31_9PAST|nr:hypothetical protein BKG89_10050 [Rodentibacter heylii]